MKTISLSLSMLCAAGMLCFTAPVSRAQIVNGGFESGAFAPGWTLTDTDPLGPLSNVGSDPAFAHSGTYHANLGTAFPPAAPSMGSLSQTFSTIAGGSYSLSFWLAHDIDVAPSNSFVVLFNNVPILSLLNVGASGYTQYNFANLIASGGSTTLEFRFQDSDDFFRLDDVAVNGVPDSGTTALLAFPVLAGLLIFRTRREPGAQA